MLGSEGVAADILRRVYPSCCRSQTKKAEYESEDEIRLGVCGSENEPVSMAEAEDGFLSTPPTEFKRMLSWQLSQPRKVAVRRRKAKKERKQSWEGEGVEDEGGSRRGLDSPVDDEDFEDSVYFVVNSEGEEEAYYSAPESPLGSEDEITSSSTSVSGWSDHGGPLQAASAGLPGQVRKPGNHGDCASISSPLSRLLYVVSSLPST